MSYMEAIDVPARAAGASVPIAADNSRLSPLEERVVQLALRDPRSSVRPLRRGARLANFIFGSSQPNSLADPRLEALRRFTVEERDGAADPAVLSAAGFSQRQTAQAQTIVRRHQGANRRSRPSPLLIALLALAGIAYRIVNAVIGDDYVSALVTCVFLLPTLPFFARLQSPSRRRGANGRHFSL